SHAAALRECSLTHLGRSVRIGRERSKEKSVAAFFVEIAFCRTVAFQRRRGDAARLLVEFLTRQTKLADDRKVTFPIGAKAFLMRAEHLRQAHRSSPRPRLREPLRFPPPCQSRNQNRR